MKAAMVAAVMLGVSATVAAAPLPSLTGPVVDPAALLSPAAAAKVRAAALSFKKATGHWLVVVVLPNRGGVDLSPMQNVAAAPWEPADARAPIGIVYAASPDDAAGMLLVVDPDWRRVAPDGWIEMFPQRLAQKYGDAPFEDRVVRSAQYLAEVFPDKIAFLLKPPDVIGEESIEFSDNAVTVIKWFCYFIILFTFVRTFWPARLSDKDTDAFSNELRRLKNERQIW